MLSYSTICSLDRQLKGESASLEVSEKSKEIGVQLHLAALQPEKYDPDKDEYRSIIIKMMRSLNSNLIYKNFMQPEGKSEYEHYWTCKNTGVKCMAKVDRELPIAVLDLKTTSCTGQKEFEAAIDAYYYDMQAAFYLDGCKKNFFYIVGVQKKFPYETFTLSFTATDPIITKGREKYITIISEAKANGLIEFKEPESIF